MATCIYCGQEIEFRYVGGRCVPIHPDGGWHCGSWTDDSSRQSHGAASWEWADHDFTHPTSCPECGADVFFIRHNGGSVWVDALGWPWPKHECFDKPGEATREFAGWSPQGARLTNPKFGVITEVRFDSRHTERILEIRLNDSTRLTLVPRWTGLTGIHPGSLVMMSREDNMLLLPDYGEVAFHSLIEFPTEKNGWTQCPRCKTWVVTGQYPAHDAHCRAHHDPTKRR